MAPKIPMDHALIRGRYMKAVARMESFGIPVDLPLLNLNIETYMNPLPTSVFLKESEAAKYLGISKKTLQRWRFDHKGPAYAKLNNNLIRYHLPELDE